MADIWTVPLPAVGIDDIGIVKLGYEFSQSCYALSNQGSFSTGDRLATGALSRNDGSQTWLWQIETNGHWRWEIGDYRDSLSFLHQDRQIKTINGVPFLVRNSRLHACLSRYV